MSRGSPDWQPRVGNLHLSETGGAVPYEQKITVPANTAEGDPVSQAMVMEKGFVSHVWIRFPSGPAGLTGIAVFEGEECIQVWPGSGWFTGDNEIIEFDVERDVDLVGEDYKLTLKGYNEDDSYEHSALVRMWVVKLP